MSKHTPLTFRYHKRSGIVVVTIFKKLFMFTVPKIEVFPALYYRSVHCCDHGGRAVSGQLEFIRSKRHLKKRQSLNFGDGSDTWTRVGWVYYFKNVLRERRIK